MKFSAELKRNIMFIILGTFLFGCIMLLVFFLLNRVSFSVILGAFIGCTAASINFVLLALSLQKALLSSKGFGKALAGVSYTFRNLMMLGIAILAIWLLKANPFALLIPYIFPRLSILVLQVTGLYNNKDLPAADEKGDEKDVR
ncbi:MAG: hypothetical protein ACK5L3_14265 [Oscillospiraceae bacterium]